MEKTPKKTVKQKLEAGDIISHLRRSTILLMYGCGVARPDQHRLHMPFAVLPVMCISKCFWYEAMALQWKATSRNGWRVCFAPEEEERRS